MWTRRSFLALTTAAAAMPMATVAQAASSSTSPSASADLRLTLPAPTGPHRLGVRTLHLIQRGRPDPWNGSPDRELMLSVFYPALTTRGFPLAPQMTSKAAQKFSEIDAVFLHPLPKSGVDWSATLTHSVLNAPAVPVRRPVVLYSPGGADPRTLGTSVAEELASHGYVVVTIDHPGETSEVEFPDGRVREIQMPPTTATDPVLSRLMIQTRLADITFVLSQLKLLAAGARGLGRALDLRRIGIYGHSAGGATAAQALYENPELRSAVNLEGYLDYLPFRAGDPHELYPIAQHGTDRPLLLVGTDGFHDSRFESSWSALLSHGGPVRRTEVVGADHWVFTDFAAMAPQLQAAGLMSAHDRARLIGMIEPGRSIPLIRGMVRRFFDQTLCRRQRSGPGTDSGSKP
ncbi:alpha/beta hydrolase family protein [Kribbella sp. CA-294648]|uniref:alpha/beta hydrolase family protein n=1 Tax=Kribbella sp. CA-294648 TaxID=3239948 RepID=UPI003D909DAB